MSGPETTNNCTVTTTTKTTTIKIITSGHSTNNCTVTTTFLASHDDNMGDSQF